MQGGIISPDTGKHALDGMSDLLATKNKRVPRKNEKYSPMVNMVRYADDFKLFTKSYQQARKLFYAVQDWLKGRLGLDISPEKSKIVNLRKRYSEFLGLRIKAANHGSKQKPNYI